MRTIEEKIIETLNGCDGVKKLSCRDCVKVDGNTKNYYLWNNLIFWSNDDDGIYYFSGRGWNSSTTKSRLNALLCNFLDAGITQKNWDWFLEWNGKKYPVDSSSVYKFNNKLYRLGSHEEEVKPL